MVDSMSGVFRGTVWKFGDNICPDTAVGYPWSDVLKKDLRSIKDPKEFAKIFMVRINPEIPNKIKKGDLVVAGKNFGTDRVHDPFWNALKSIGIPIVIAESFAKIFYRRAIDRGYPLLECKGVTQKVSQGDEIEVNYKTGLIKNLTTSEEIKGQPFPDILIEIIEAGGSLPWLKKKVAKTQMHR
jgi:3-isopropylmalate/(R)-2-methylmalate dehydratase small subunit